MSIFLTNIPEILYFGIVLMNETHFLNARSFEFSACKKYLCFVCVHWNLYIKFVFVERMRYFCIFVEIIADVDIARARASFSQVDN